jgi:hypothetical protein
MSLQPLTMTTLILIKLPEDFVASLIVFVRDSDRVEHFPDDTRHYEIIK